MWSARRTACSWLVVAAVALAACDDGDAGAGRGGDTADGAGADGASADGQPGGGDGDSVGADNGAGDDTAAGDDLASGDGDTQGADTAWDPDSWTPLVEDPWTAFGMRLEGDRVVHRGYLLTTRLPPSVGAGPLEVTRNDDAQARWTPLFLRRREASGATQDTPVTLSAALTATTAGGVRYPAVLPGIDLEVVWTPQAFALRWHLTNPAALPSPSMAMAPVELVTRLEAPGDAWTQVGEAIELASPVTVHYHLGPPLVQTAPDTAPQAMGGISHVALSAPTGGAVVEISLMMPGDWLQGAPAGTVVEQRLGIGRAPMVPFVNVMTTPGQLTVALDAVIGQPPPTGTRYQLSWGDGAQDGGLLGQAALTSQHVYAAPGSYAVAVAVCDDGVPPTCGQAEAIAVVSAGAAADADGDGRPDASDPCPQQADPGHLDTDEDGIGDACDPCPHDKNDAAGASPAPCQSTPAVQLAGGVQLTPAAGLDPALAALPFAAVEVLVRVKAVLPGHPPLPPGVVGKHKLKVVGAVQRDTLRVAASSGVLAALAAEPVVDAVFALPAAAKIAEGLWELGEGQAPAKAAAAVVYFAGTTTADQAKALVLAHGVKPAAPFVATALPLALSATLTVAQVEALAADVRVAAIGAGGEAESTVVKSKAATGGAFLGGMGIVGKGIRLAEIEPGWANGDTQAPPTQPAGGAHIAFGGRVRIRDTQAPDGPVPSGCGGFQQFICSAAMASNPNVCVFAQHATAVAGIMIGDGAGAAAAPAQPWNPVFGAGYAPAVPELLNYAHFDTIALMLCKLRDAYTLGARAANHSWGSIPKCSAYGAYPPMAAAHDGFIRDHDRFPQIWAGGNWQLSRVPPWDAGRSHCNKFPLKLPSQGGTCTPPPITWTSSPCKQEIHPIASAPEPPAKTLLRFSTVTSIYSGQSSKNGIQVGAVFSEPHALMPNQTGAPLPPVFTKFSSMGPTLDGRLVPLIVAPGQWMPRIAPVVAGIAAPAYPGAGAYSALDNAGTSMAAPAVTGGVAQLLQLADRRMVALPNAVLKALLLHTARDVPMHKADGSFASEQTPGDDWWSLASGHKLDGPDFATGYGLLDLQKAMNKLMNGNPGGTLVALPCGKTYAFAQLPFELPVALGQTGVCPGPVQSLRVDFAVPKGTQMVRATLVWDDPPPAPGAAKTLVNDLDLVLLPGKVKVKHYSWWLDPSCPWQPAARPVTKCWLTSALSDHRNNHEQVEAWAASSGDQWAADISATALPVGPQRVALMLDVK